MLPGHQFESENDVMRYALQVAEKGTGCVEPNPPVGAVVVDENLTLIAEGFHEQFGKAHAEVNAIAAATPNTTGQQLFVTLEPCNHTGKTPPCTEAVINADFRRVFIGCADPARHTTAATTSSGVDRLRAAGIEVTVGVCEAEASRLIAPFRKLMTSGLPWVHAKWAITLDGRIASRTGHSKWISGEESRAEVHRLRGRMDAIITAAGTVRADDPLMTARPPGPRTASRIVLDADGKSVQPGGKLMTSIHSAPLMICISEDSNRTEHVRRLRDLGAEILSVPSRDHGEIAAATLQELGRRKMTHVLLEGGPGLIGSFFDQQLIDEVHVFVAPKIVGGVEAIPAVGGTGLEAIPQLSSLRDVEVRQFGRDVLIEGRVSR